MFVAKRHDVKRSTANDRNHRQFLFYATALSPLVLGSIFASNNAEARVTRLLVEERVVIEDSNYKGVGSYERLKGRAHFAVDPKDKRNKVIYNLDKAPKNKDNLVEFSSPFVIVKPLDFKRGNRKIFYGINNRGNCIELSFRSLSTTPPTCFPTSVAQLGADNPLFTEGFTWVDAGWHGDGIKVPNSVQLFPDFPVATNRKGKSIEGPHRIELQLNAAAFSSSLVPGWRPYPAGSLDNSGASLTVRASADGNRKRIDNKDWAFGICPDGKSSLKPSDTDICLFDGFKPLSIYELYYTAKDPIVMGLAYAVTRDLASFLRSKTEDDDGNKNPLLTDGNTVKRAYVSGTSSTGMYLRDWLYLGFNEDEDGKQVFEAANIYSAAAHRLFANVQFASPTYYSGQDQHQDYTSNAIPPFTFGVTTDPLTGAKDGILKRPKTDPLVLQTDEELVFWQWKASLNVVDTSGKPIKTPDNVRLYFQNGWGHIGAVGLLSPFTPAGRCTLPGQGASSSSWTTRALVNIIDDWADRGVSPPDSNYPRFESDELVTLKKFRSLFPNIPGLTPPMNLNELNVLNYGPYFDAEGGKQTLLPPAKGPAYRLFVPKPRKDGDGAAGVDFIHTRAPIGTNVGWSAISAPREADICSLSGSYVPFARTEDERVRFGDPRPSLEERYGDHKGFVRSVTKAANQLVDERFLLARDAKKFIDAAEASDVLK